jgi:SNF2 family DNA or RNA helicase
MFTKASLIIVPSHLLGQWPEEIEKFLGKKKKVVTLTDMNSLNKARVSDILNADIVIASFFVLANDTYYARLARLCGVNLGKLPSDNASGRHFEAR